MNKLIKIIIVAFMTALVWSSITNAQQIEDEMRKMETEVWKDKSHHYSHHQGSSLSP